MNEQPNADLKLEGRFITWKQMQHNVEEPVQKQFPQRCFYKKVFWKHATNLLDNPCQSLQCDFIQSTFYHGRLL